MMVMVILPEGLCQSNNSFHLVLWGPNETIGLMKNDDSVCLIQFEVFRVYERAFSFMYV